MIAFPSGKTVTVTPNVRARMYVFRWSLKVSVHFVFINPFPLDIKKANHVYHAFTASHSILTVIIF